MKGRAEDSVSYDVFSAFSNIMNTTQLKQSILDGKFDKEFIMLYGETDVARTRYCEAVDEFVNLYGQRDNVRLFSAPGRTEIGGNHTDHQHGLVLAGSVNLDVIAVVSANNNGVIRIKSKGYQMDEINTDNLEKVESETGRSRSLVRGVLAAFKNGGYNVGGFDAYTTSNVLKGSGLSSSAAYEVLIGNVLSGLYNGGQLNPIVIAQIGQEAERDFFGKPFIITKI